MHVFATTPSLSLEVGVGRRPGLTAYCIMLLAKNPKNINVKKITWALQDFDLGEVPDKNVLASTFIFLLQRKWVFKKNTVGTVSYFGSPRPEKEPQFKFIYFNHMNLAEKSTIHMRKTASVSLTSVHPDLMKILGDINSDFARYNREGSTQDINAIFPLRTQFQCNFF